MPETENQKIKSQLPLTEASFYILLSLAGGGKHGYAILKEIEQLSEGALVLSTSTLYSALERLQEQDLIERTDSDPDLAAPGLPRKVYILTQSGMGVLAAERARLSHLLRAANQQLEGRLNP